MALNCAYQSLTREILAMMTSLLRNAIRHTGPLWRESTNHSANFNWNRSLSGWLGNRERDVLGVSTVLPQSCSGGLYERSQSCRYRHGVWRNCYIWVSVLTSLQWRHKEHDRVSNHQHHDCLLNRLFRRWSKKTSKLRVTGLCAGNPPGTGEFPAPMASNAEHVSIWWRHHVFGGVNRINILLQCMFLCSWLLRA